MVSPSLHLILRHACTRVCIAVALVLATGCFVGASRDERLASTTHLTAMRLGSRTPPLPLFVVRIAQSELPLSDDQAKTVAALATDADATTHPIDDARIVFLEVLAQSVDQGALASASVNAAADRVVRATEQATPELVAQVEELHRTLTPVQRRILVQLMIARFDAWAPLWDAATPRRPLEGATRQWITALRDEDTRAVGAAMALDTTMRARQWTTDLVKHVVAADLPRLDLAKRRALIIQLRTDTMHLERANARVNQP